MSTILPVTIYRQSIAADREQINYLMEKLLVHLAKISPTRKDKPEDGFTDIYHDRVIKLVQQKKANILVAEQEGVVVGFGFGVIKEHNIEALQEFKDLKSGLITDLYVDCNYRGQGIGRELVKQFMAYFKANGCHQAEIYVLHANDQAHELYKRLGFKDELSEMCIPL
ncbi:MAG: GNAT family N-acetyltransferase [bacterium]